jgi:hypothetical protein
MLARRSTTARREPGKLARSGLPPLGRPIPQVFRSLDEPTLVPVHSNSSAPVVRLPYEGDERSKCGEERCPAEQHDHPERANGGTRKASKTRRSTRGRDCSGGRVLVWAYALRRVPDGGKHIPRDSDGLEARRQRGRS